LPSAGNIENKGEVPKQDFSFSYINKEDFV